jgi:xylulokinase/glycerol kinase
VAYCLTGEYATDFTQAGRTLLMNIEKFAWEDDLLSIGGIRPEQMPRLVPPGSICGKLNADSASQTGLPQGLPVIISGGDQQDAAVALGVTEKGNAEANTGTGSFVLSYAEQPVFDKTARVLVQASAIAGKWIIEAGIFNSGSIYRWFKEQYCRDFANESEPYNLMNQEAEASGPGAHGVVMLPHFEGSAAPFWNPMAKGLFFNLSLRTSRGDMDRAILEAIAMEINECLSLIEELTGEIGLVHVAGGMVKSDLFCRIQAGAYNKGVVRYRNSEASSLGACMTASPALGLYPSVEEAARAMNPGLDKTFQPHPGDVAVYQKMESARRKLYRALESSDVYPCFMNII